MRIRQLDFRELGERLRVLQSDLESMESEVTDAEASVAEAQAAAAGVQDTEDPVHEDLSNAQGALTKAEEALQDWHDDNGADLKELLTIESEIESYKDEQGIHEDDFEDYARDLHGELHGSRKADEWPYTCIDWEKAANALKVDYVTVNYDGQDYLVRG